MKSNATLAGLAGDKDVLDYLRARFPMFHLSNFFFRDVQFGVQRMLMEKGRTIGYGEAERIARDVVKSLEQHDIFRPVDRQTWMVNFPAFRKPPVTVTPPAGSTTGGARQ